MSTDPIPMNGGEPPRRFDVLGDLVEYQVSGRASGGAYLLVKIFTPPGGGPRLLHTHPPQESFLVLEGEVTFFSKPGDRIKRETASKGGVFHIPAGQPHTFRNLTDKPAVVWALFAPPQVMDDFFTKAGREVSSDQELDLGGGSVDETLRIGAELGMQWFDPVPSE